MYIGIDFDNTIVCYDRVFHMVAREYEAIPEDLPATKESVRDFLRAAGRESEWTVLQGYVYGMRMGDAEPFPGVLDFLRRCRERGVATCVVSHKTRTPYLGPAYDLRGAALGWMEACGLFEADGIGLSRERVFWEPTKKDKLGRIGLLGCTHFIDDLPELLTDADFPAGVTPVLFAPAGPPAAAPGIVACASWDQIGRHLLDGGADASFGHG